MMVLMLSNLNIVLDKEEIAYTLRGDLFSSKAQISKYYSRDLIVKSCDFFFSSDFSAVNGGLAFSQETNHG
jgi:hypothetical protein